MLGTFSSLASAWAARIVAGCGWDVSRHSIRLTKSTSSLIKNMATMMMGTCTTL